MIMQYYTHICITNRVALQGATWYRRAMSNEQPYHCIVGWDEDLEEWVANVVEEPALRAVGPTAEAARRALSRDVSDIVGPLMDLDPCAQPFHDCT